jgi:hypothetical protein
LTNPLQVQVLVDFDNVVPDPVTTRTSAEDALALLKAELGPRIQALFPDVIDAVVRLYSAWRWADGTVMRVRADLADVAALAGSTEFGYPLIFELSDVWTSPRSEVTAYKQDAVCRCFYKTLIREQKLVDTMLVADFIYFATFPTSGVIAVSDDHDVIPGIAHGSFLRATVAPNAKPGDLVWLRPSTLAGRADRMLPTSARITDFGRTMR